MLPPIKHYLSKKHTPLFLKSLPLFIPFSLNSVHQSKTLTSLTSTGLLKPPLIPSVTSTSLLRFTKHLGNPGPLLATVGVFFVALENGWTRNHNQLPNSLPPTSPAPPHSVKRLKMSLLTSLLIACSLQTLSLCAPTLTPIMHLKFSAISFKTMMFASPLDLRLP